MVISNAPSRLNPKAMNRAAMKPLTQGFEPSVTIPKGPRRGGGEPDSGEQHDDSEAEDQRLDDTFPPSPDCRFRKYDIVIGIIGKTQGVKIDARPNPKATARKPASLSGGAASAAGASAGALGSAYPLGMDGRRRRRGGVDGECSGAGPLGGNALVRVAGLVTGGEREFDGAGGRVLLQLHLQQEGRRLRRSRFRN